jgi:hypothetical protein
MAKKEKKVKKPRGKKSQGIEYQVDSEIFASDPYEVTSAREDFSGNTWHKTGQRLSDEFESGEGRVEGLERKRYATSDGGEKIVQVESSPAFEKSGFKMSGMKFYDKNYNKK